MCDVSSIVNEAIKTIFVCLFFLGKNFEYEKHKTSKNQPTKQKQGNKKTTKATFFRAQKLYKREKIVCFVF